MIRTENYMIGEREFTRTWSDAHRYVVRDGTPYIEANDPSEFGRTYTEGDLIPRGEWEDDPNAATAEDYEAALKEMGVRV